MGLRRPEQNYDDYEIARKKIQQRGEVDRGRAQDTLQRQYARLGGLSSGSYIKQNQLVDQEVDEKIGDQRQEITALELAERRKAGQGDVEREFAAGEAEKQRGFQREQSTQDLGFREKLFSFDKETKLRQLDLAQRELDNDARTTEFNKMISILGLDKGEARTSGLRGMIEDPNTSPAAKAAANQFLAGMSESYMTIEDQQRKRGPQVFRGGGVDTSALRIVSEGPTKLGYLYTWSDGIKTLEPRR